ncbi:MAG: DJ-1/PfpI family protein [Congregibacter sp.]
MANDEQEPSKNQPQDSQHEVAQAHVLTRRDALSAGASLAIGVAAVSMSGPLLTPAARAEENNLSVAILVFDGITQLDATAPLEVFAKAGLSTFTVAPENRLITAGSGLKIMPDYDYASAPHADILCVPGGGGVNPLLTDEATLAYIRGAAGEASYVTSVCTGALLLGAAGLLKGKRATTHWASHQFLEPFGAIPVESRVVIDGNVITGGGVTAGIDFAFAVLDKVLGRDAAALTMLALEYDPAPPFAGGSPRMAPADIVSTYTEAARSGLAKRGAQVVLAAAKL